MLVRNLRMEARGLALQLALYVEKFKLLSFKTIKKSKTPKFQKKLNEQLNCFKNCKEVFFNDEIE